MQSKSWAMPTVLLLASIGISAPAQTAAPAPAGVLNLSTSATVEVTKDVLAVAFTAMREGTDAQAVQGGLKQALDAALVEARKLAKPGQVDVQTGNFALYPRYANSGKGGQPVINGWQGSAELLVQGKDIPAIAQLTGRVQTMAISRVGYQLSREARDKVEAEVTAQAIAAWRVKASQMAQQFGYGGYSVREVNVATNEQSRQPVPMLMRAAAAPSAQGESLPTEAGKGEVTAVVNGSALMTR